MNVRDEKGRRAILASERKEVGLPRRLGSSSIGFVTTAAASPQKGAVE